MRNIQELIRTKQIEILKAVEGAVEQQELELWRLRKSLLNALRTVDRLLALDETGVEAMRTEADSSAENLATPRSSVPGPVPVLTRRYEGLAPAPVAKVAGDQFPQA